jgi:fibronectin type 3 domain-containing protein
MSRHFTSRRGAGVAVFAAAFLGFFVRSAGAAPVSPPTSLTASALSSSQIRLTWTDSNSNEEGYFIERSLSSTSSFTQIASVAANATTYTSTGLAAGTTYYYRVRASFKNGTYSTYSNVASARTLSTLYAPSSLTASVVSSSQLNLTWNDTNSSETGYLVERSLSSSSGFVQIASLGANTRSYSNTGLAAATTYYYRVRAAMNGTYSTYSNVASAKTASLGTTPTPAPSGVPIAPSLLTATAISSSQISLGWRDNSNNETAFRVERSLASGGPWTFIGTTALTGYGDTGLTAGRLYYYRVQAYNSSGNSAYTNTASATTAGGTGVPAVPGSLTATTVSTSQINLAWADTSGNETGFKIERSTSTSPWAQIATTGANVASYASTGLTGATTYSYRVRAYNTSGDSGYSNTASAATSGGAAPGMWSKRYGSSADDRGQTVAVDGQGRVAVTGSFYGSTNFGGGTVASHICCAGTSTMDIFVSQYSASGAYLWSRVIGSDSDEGGKGVASDPSGNVLVTGYQGSYTVDYGGGPQYNRGGNEIFVAKYSSAGSWVWSKTVGGTGYDQGNAIASDGSGNVFVTGYIGPAAAGVDFGGGAISSAGLYDVFLVKYSAAGQHVWSKRFGGSGNDTGMAIATDSSGNVIVVGSFEGSASFGGGSFSSSGLRDVFVAKYSATGTHLWSKKFGGSGDDVGYGVAVNSTGDIFLSGKFQGTVNFGGSNLGSAGGDDIFLTKLSGSTGAHVWSKGMGSSSSDASIGVDVDGSGNVVMTGYFTGSVNLGGALLSGSGIDVFVAKYSSTGTHIWSKRFGGFDTQIPNGVAVGPGGEAVVTGYFASSIDFGTGVLTSLGSYDAFLTNVGP